MLYAKEPLLNEYQNSSTIQNTSAGTDEESRQEFIKTVSVKTREAKRPEQP